MEKIEYNYYCVALDSEEHKGLAKLGWSIDPINRPDGYQTGTIHKLIIGACWLGNQDDETEMKRKFAKDRVGVGGKEWYRITPELIEFVREKSSQSLYSLPVFRIEKFANSPNRIERFELGKTRPSSALPIQSVGSIQPCDIPEAPRAKTAFEKQSQKRTK
jgi:hypothetical protein